MGTVVVYPADYILELLEGVVVGANITDGHLILVLRDTSTIDLGTLVSNVPDADTSTRGVVELATDTETIAGSDSAKVVTPLGLAALTSTETRKGLIELATTAEATTGTDTTRAVTPAGLKAVADTKQAVDADLTAIAALTKTNDNVLQVKSGAWTERTMAQLATDLAATGEFPDVMLHNGSAYVDADTTKIYVGPTDPGAVTNGCIWYDTTGA